VNRWKRRQASEYASPLAFAALQLVASKQSGDESAASARRWLGLPDPALLGESGRGLGGCRTPKAVGAAGCREEFMISTQVQTRKEPHPEITAIILGGANGADSRKSEKERGHVVRANFI
jgi:hypothetical protein